MSKKLEEYVKGSIDYVWQSIRKAFYLQFPQPNMTGAWQYNIEEVFDDHVVVYARLWVDGTSKRDPLNEDEYYQVDFQKSGESYLFSTRDQWKIIEMKYADKTMAESREGSKHKGKRLEESIIPAQVQLLEAKAEDKTRRIRINGLMEADKLNGNHRRYSKSVLESAVLEWKNHLHESAGQGRLKILTGEVEHPTEKGNKRPQFLETVVVWDTLHWNGERLDIEGNLIETSKGRDVLALMEAGVLPGGSVRGAYDAKSAKEGKTLIEEVTWCSFTGADLVGDPSFSNAAELTESINQKPEDEMNLEELLKMLKEHPELFEGINRDALEKMGDAQLKRLEESMRVKLGVGTEADLGKALDGLLQAQKELNESKRATLVGKAIEDATQQLPYGEEGNKSFVEAIRAANPQDGEAVKSLVESKRREYDKIFAGRKLEKLGFTGKITGIKPVLESETQTPEFARASFELTESIRKYQNRPVRQQALTLNELYAQKVLERFDTLYKGHLLQESRMFEEAEQASDLNLPYSVSRAVIAEAFPSLVASGIFDVGIMENSPTNLYFEHFSGETGYAPTVTDEVVAASHNAWVSLANQRLSPGTVVVTNSGATVTYTEDTDYLMDYANGRFYALSTGAITNAQSLKVDYTYTAIRKGEMVAIERGKLTIDFITITAKADRLADQISREAIVFSRSQLGFDAVLRTLASLVRQTTRKIDQGMLYMALSAVKTVAGNSGGTWTAASDTLDDLVKKIGVARVLVGKRYYEPTFALMSLSNMDKLANWENFEAAGSRPDADISANGYVGRVKGLHVFNSTEFTDGHIVVGNSELVQHRIYQPMQTKGPYPSYDSNGKIVAADQYYTEEFNATETPVPSKGAFVKVA